MQLSLLSHVFILKPNKKLQLFKKKHTTSELVALCKQGNPKAQFELYQLYAKAMFNTALRILGNKEDAEDVLQESFLDGFRKLDLFREESTFGAWLKSIVINKSISKLRSIKLKFEDVENNVNIADEEDEQIEEDEETLKRIKHLMKQLPDGFRVVLSLYLFEGYDHKEIGEILHISEVTSRSQFLRAKQRLLQLYYQQA